MDGVCLYPWRDTAEADYCENVILGELRQAVGPRFSLSSRWTLCQHRRRDGTHVNAMVAYHTAPHIDAFDTGEGGAMLLQILAGAALAMGFAKIPFLLPVRAQTIVGTMGEDAPRGRAGVLTGIVSASLMNGIAGLMFLTLVWLRLS